MQILGGKIGLRKVRFLGSKGPPEKLEKQRQDEGKGPHRYGPCSLLPVCASPWAKCGRVDTTFCPAFFISS
jgi:hypothetical protein